MLFQRSEHSSTFGIKTLTNANAIWPGIAFIKVLISIRHHLLFVVAALTVSPLFAEGLKLSTSETEPTAGYFSLSWTGTKQQNDVLLQQSTLSSFSNDALMQWTVSNVNSFSMSGLSSGVYYYRVAPFDKPQSWSNVVQVNVKHHSLNKAFFIFAVGAALFSLLSIIIFLNSKNKTSGI